LRTFDYAIAKGRSNYVCLRRLKAFRPATKEEASEHASYSKWASGTDIGDFEEYHSGKSFIREKICSDADTCKKVRCQYFKDCYYYAARGKWERAQVVVANHALLAVNAMMPADAKIFPVSDVLVVDEGHTLDAVLSDQIGINLSDRRFEYILNGLLKTDDRGNYKGLLVQSPNLFRVVESARADMMLFWIKVRNELRHRASINGVFQLRDSMLALASSIRALMEEIRTSVIGGLFREDDEIELRASLMKMITFAEEMETFAEGVEGFIRWSEVEERRTALRMSPIYPREFVQEKIIPEYRSLVFTSATLSVGGDFRLVTDVLGLEHSRTLSLPSPFDLKKQASVVIQRGINLAEERGIENLAAVILEESSGKDGGILVLFTSKDVMRKTWALVSDQVAAMGLHPMMQGGEKTNKIMLGIMRESTSSVIFGLDSFWEGIDVKGDALKCLIVTKLPFEVPTEPMVAARVQAIRESGGDPFEEYTLPKAILKFKQGFGRLIRSKTDIGRVVICDERIETKRYGSRFLRAVL
jgi:ATP-dependent DNA helicase DinG